MILPDLNLLLHTYNSSSPLHAVARRWWESCMMERRPVLLPWAVVLGFLRLSTHPKMAANPLPVPAACEIVDSWFARPHVATLDPEARHREILFDLLRVIGTGGNLTTDAHLAALAIEHDLELLTTDSDFRYFPGLRWQNPLVKLE